MDSIFLSFCLTAGFFLKMFYLILVRSIKLDKSRGDFRWLSIYNRNGKLCPLVTGSDSLPVSLR